MSRKTIEVAEIRKWCNNILAHPEREISGMVAGLTAEQAYRKATSALLEAVLHRTDNYKGFRYDDPQGTLITEPTFADWIANGGDETRRVYY